MSAAYEWDEAKAASNPAKHGVSFLDATEVFEDPGRVEVDVSRVADDETRFKIVGTFEGRLLAVVYTPRGDTVRLISARPPIEQRRSSMAIIRYVRDPSKPHTMSPETRARLDALTDEQITAAAESDPDNPPLTDAELARFRAMRIAKAARRRTGLSQAKFAQAYHIKVARLRDLEQGRRAPDEVLVSLLTLIHDDPERAARVLREEL